VASYILQALPGGESPSVQVVPQLGALPNEPIGQLSGQADLVHRGKCSEPRVP